MKKANKILLGLAPLGATLAVLPLAAACGPKSPRFEQKNDKIIKIATGFATDGTQYAALNSMVKEYNKTLTDGWKVEIANLSGGYDTGTLTKKLEAKDDSQLWNIIINYPAASSIIASYDMSLSIPDETYNKFGFAPAFKNVNETVAGNTKNEKLVVPMSRSTEMISVAKPLLGKLLKELIDEANVTRGSSTTLIDSYIDYYKAQTDEARKIDELWRPGKVTITEELKAEIQKLVPQLDDSIFQSYEPLINMTIAMKKMYANSKQLYIFGFDSVPTAINTMVSAANGGKINKGYITPDESKSETGGWDYDTFLKNPSSEQRKVFKDAADIIIKGINAGALWIGGNGSYGSSQLTGYKLAMSQGSTAGWSYTFVNSKGDITEIYGKDTEKALKLQDNEVFAKVEKDGEFAVFKIGKYKNKVYKSTYTGELTKYEFKLSPDSDNLNFSEYTGWYLQSGKDLKVVDNQLVISYKKGDQNAEFKVPAGKFKELPNVVKNRKSENYYLISPEVIEKVVLTSSDVLNESDADWIPTPYNKLASEKHKAVFVQGPSLIGIHANAEEDQKTLDFINWFFTKTLAQATIEHTKNGKTTTTVKENTTPIDAFNLYGGYVSPTVTFFSKKPTDLGLNKANTLAFNQFDLINKNSEIYVSAEDVASVKSDSLRKIISTAAINLYETAATDQTVTFDSFIGKILDSFKAA